MKRVFDIFFVLMAVAWLVIPFALIWIIILFTSEGSAIYWSKRIGRQGHIFMMPKFRSMHISTPEVATDKLDDADHYITRLGSFLRRTSLDELPQIYSVLRGDMSVVGPRPALYSQLELISRRAELGIDQLRPGMTGWAQINGRDEIVLEDKLNFDKEYLARHSLFFDLKIIFLTLLVVVRSRGVSH